MVDDNRWRVDRHISIGHIVTTLLVVIGLFKWAGDVDKRINGNTQNIKHERELREAESKHIKEAMEVIDKKVDRNGLKLDRVLERMNGRYE